MSVQKGQTGRERDASQRRLRDFIILTFGAISVIGMLFLTGAIGLIEWLTGSIVMLAGSLAFYVGSLPAPVSTNLQKSTSPGKPAKLRPSAAIIPYIQSLPFPALLIGDDNRLKTVNAGAREILTMTDNNQALVTSVVRQPDLLNAAERVAQSSAAERVEFSLRDDHETWMAHLQAGPDTGTVLIIFEDLTDVRRAELARADFLANASHELRTPLTAVSGFIETMLGPAKDDKASWDGFLEIMQQQTGRMERLVADLLSLSRIEFDEHRSPSTSIDATALVARAEQSLQPIAAKAKVTLDLSIPDQPLYIVADADEVMQVIQNLATNAIKYAASGGTVTIALGDAPSMANAANTCARQLDGADRALLLTPRASTEVPAMYLRVVDDGEGIPPQHLPRLGERFYRTDESRGGKIEGTGLGLAIVKHIMARHRGGLAVESIEGTGTAFGIWMPLAPTVP